MKLGDLISLKAYGETIQRRLVDMNDTHVFVCTIEEYELAAKQCRLPISVGFKKTLII